MRYIDADALYTKIPNDSPYKSSLKRLLLQAPTVDVVPRAKYEEVYSALDIACKSLDYAVAMLDAAVTGQETLQRAFAEERCVACDEIIPEGRQVCPTCENE
jgi:hypothetical protein